VKDLLCLLRYIQQQNTISVVGFGAFNVTVEIQFLRINTL